MRHWDARRRRLMQAGVPAFLETSEGLAWLTRLIWVLLYVMTLRCPSGIRAICEVLELSGLDKVVASSFGSVQKMAGQVLEVVDAVGEDFQRKLCESTAEETPRRVTICEDETFHPATCLVAVEPVSGFIVLEQYAERRDAKTWSAAVDKALEGLPVNMVQATSDEAQALKKHAREDQQAHHSPDLFHVQNEVQKATAFPLANRQRDADRELARAMDAVTKAREQQEASERGKRRTGTPLDHEQRLEAARVAEGKAREAACAAAADREDVRQAIAAISTAYHPYDLTTGSPQSAGDVAWLVGQCFGHVDEVAQRAGLLQRCLDRIEKAWRVTEDMNATIAWTHLEIGVRLQAADLTNSERELVTATLVPGLYIQSAAAKASPAKKRHAVQANADKLLASFDDAVAALPSFDAERRAEVVTVAQACAEAFQRSSSCVEGRNGHLALFHHGVHRLLPAKLRALTVTHNFHVTRPDGSTAAERLFGCEHPGLFETVLGRLPALARPAQNRSARGCRRAAKKAAQCADWIKR